MWPGAEPSKGTFNQTYIDGIADIVAALGNAGIYSILGLFFIQISLLHSLPSDAHQDIFNRKFCGEGYLQILQQFHSSHSIKAFLIGQSTQTTSLFLFHFLSDSQWKRIQIQVLCIIISEE
jgi:hypothetical protein